jgi:hypothetical protein
MIHVLAAIEVTNDPAASVITLSMIHAKNQRD